MNRSAQRAHHIDSNLMNGLNSVLNFTYMYRRVNQKKVFSPKTQNQLTLSCSESKIPFFIWNHLKITNIRNKLCMRLNSHIIHSDISKPVIQPIAIDLVHLSQVPFKNFNAQMLLYGPLYSSSGCRIVTGG